MTPEIREMLRRERAKRGLPDYASGETPRVLSDRERWRMHAAKRYEEKKAERKESA